MWEHYPELFARVDFEDEVWFNWGRIVTSNLEYVVYVENTCAGLSMLGVHRVCMAYVRDPQTLKIRGWMLFKHHYGLQADLSLASNTSNRF